MTGKPRDVSCDRCACCGGGGGAAPGSPWRAAARAGPRLAALADANEAQHALLEQQAAMIQVGVGGCVGPPYKPQKRPQALQASPRRSTYAGGPCMPAHIACNRAPAAQDLQAASALLKDDLAQARASGSQVRRQGAAGRHAGAMRRVKGKGAACCMPHAACCMPHAGHRMPAPRRPAIAWRRCSSSWAIRLLMPPAAS